MSDIESTSVEELQVAKKVSVPKSEIGSSEFVKELDKLLTDSQPWRSSAALAEALNVDTHDLDKFCRKQTNIVSKPSKIEGVFLYGYAHRTAPEDKKDDKGKKDKKDKKELSRPLVTEEDRYAIASIHGALMLLESTLQKYALRIHERNSEAFTKLAKAREDIEAGLYLYAKKVHANLDKLPKV
jgi:hypothetical protein